MVRTATLLVLLSLATVLSWVAVSLATEPQVPNLENALEAQRQRVASSPSAAGYNDLGNLLVLAERFDDAESAYLRAVELAPGETGARFNLGVLYQQLGRGRDAEQQFETVLEVDPADAWAHYQLGVILAGRKDRKSALDHYAHALALDPSLTFAENNPHIIDNKLFGEALLMSQRYSQTQGSGVARQYGEPERIRALLLGETPPSQSAAAAGDAAAVGAANDPRRMPQAHPKQASPQATPVASSDTSGQGGPRGAGGRGTQTVLVAPSSGTAGEEKPAAAAPPGSRTAPATPEPAEPFGRPGRGAPGVERPVPPPSARPDVGQPGTSTSRPQPSQPLVGTSFRPSRRSTAQLELRLEAMPG